MVYIASATLVPAALGWFSFVVTSASMTPTILPGAVVVVNPNDRLIMQAGDVGTFVDVQGGFRVTHRVIEVITEGDKRVYRTKGDATANIDGELRQPDYTVGRVVYNVPLVGYLSFAMGNPLYRNLALGTLTLLLGVSLLRGAATRRQNKIVLGPMTMEAGGEVFGTPIPKVSEAVARPLIRATQAAATIVAGIAVITAAAALLPIAWDWHPFTMPDNSMVPAIAPGALVMTEPTVVSNLSEGDMITFMPTQERGRVYIRRVANKTGDSPGNTVIRTKGDNLPSPDPLSLDGTQVVGKVVYTLPYLGDVLAWAGSRQGFMVFGGLIAALLIGRVMYRSRTVAPAA
ncbi:MAG: signal peptidase I [Chloroflexi bacterium]|nr:signal peptidase I [Chloroflexota bacterium]